MLTEADYLGAIESCDDDDGGVGGGDVIEFRAAPFL